MSSRFARVVAALGPKNALRIMQLYPPYLGAGVRVDDIADDLSAVSVSMRLHRWNMNAVGSHFGGSLYAMCDPWFMLLLMARLGDDFIVWDKSARIDFVRPGRGKVSARFDVGGDVEAAVRTAVAADGKTNPVLTVEVKDEAAVVVCRVEKTLSVRRKPR